MAQFRRVPGALPRSSPLEFLAGISCEPGVESGAEKQILKHASRNPSGGDPLAPQTGYTAPATLLFRVGRGRHGFERRFPRKRLRARDLQRDCGDRLVREIEDERFEDSTSVSAAVAVLSVQVLHERFVSLFSLGLPSLAARSRTAKDALRSIDGFEAEAKVAERRHRVRTESLSPGDREDSASF